MIDFTDERKVKAICATLASALPDYSIFWPMASGGQGLVLHTHHGPTDRPVAMKVLDGGLLGSIDAGRRFQREIRALDRLHHDHIVRVHDSGSVGDLVYFTMELIQGATVTDWRLMYEPAPAAVVQRFLQVARALAHAHRRGVIHRDIKPGNILIHDDDDDPERFGTACVVDFGMAKLIDECDDGTRSSSMQHLGTLQYMSPEQVTGEPLDSRTDLYSLGVVMYEVLSNDEFPYPVDNIGKPGIMHHIRETEPSSLRSINPDVNADLSSIVHKCLEKDREHRYRTADELCDDLEHWQRGEAVSARSDGRWYHLKKAARRHKWPLIAVSIFVVMLMAGATSATFLWQRSERLAVTYASGLQMYDLAQRGSEARDAGRTDEAVTLWLQALELDASAPLRNAEIDRMRYEALHRLAEFYLVERDVTAARPFCDDALAVAEQYLDDSDFAWRRRSAFAGVLRGRLALADKDYEGASHALSIAEDIFAQFVERDPDLPTHRKDLAYAFALHGIAYRRLNRMGDALKSYEAAHALRQGLLGENPDSVDAQIDVVQAEAQLAVWHIVQKTPEGNTDAIEWIDRAEDRLSEMRASGSCDNRPRDCRRLTSDLSKNRSLIQRRLGITP